MYTCTHMHPCMLLSLMVGTGKVNTHVHTCMICFPSPSSHGLSRHKARLNCDLCAEQKVWPYTHCVHCVWCGVYSQHGLRQIASGAAQKKECGHVLIACIVCGVGCAQSAQTEANCLRRELHHRLPQPVHLMG